MQKREKLDTIKGNCKIKNNGKLKMLFVSKGEWKLTWCKGSVSEKTTIMMMMVIK